MSAGDSSEQQSARESESDTERERERETAIDSHVHKMHQARRLRYGCA